jgi:hypothetical protein
MKRIVMLGLVLALLAAMVISTAAFAAATCDGSQQRLGTAYQYASGNGPGDGTGTGSGGPGPYLRCEDMPGDCVCK